MKSLKDYESIKEFIELLEYQGMNNEKKQLEFIIDYVDTTEKQLDAVLNELHNVRMELGTIQQKTLKATALRAVDNVTDKVNLAKDNIIKTKEFIKTTIEHGIKEFKSKGKDALVSTMKALNVKSLLQKCQHCFDKIQQSADKSIDTLTRLGNEIHQVNNHFKNIGRIIIGKDPIALKKRNHDKGVISLTQNGLFKIMEKMTYLSAKTKENIKKIDKQEQELTLRTPSKKISVKKALNDIKKTKVNKKEINKTVQKER